MKPSGFRTWLLHGCLIFWFPVSVPQPSAAESIDHSGSMSPAEAVQAFVVDDDLVVELAACEPQVVDPVDMRFDESGRMWVVEMRDYPIGPTESAPSLSRISILTDKDGDGFYESSQVFADDLAFATGIQPWRGGVIATVSGRVLLMRDTDDDDHADVTDVWFDGFAEENQQLRANHPRLALDNRVYVANGLRGGTIVDRRNAEQASTEIRGRDLRFHPFTSESSAVSGHSQFGLTFDEWGNRFGCSNRNPLFHVILEDRYLSKSPRVRVPAVFYDVAASGDQSVVYPITRSWTTSHLHAGQFTAACGVEIYRGNGLPKKYVDNAFVCEPTAHVVHCEVIAPRGVGMMSLPSHEGREFLASRDPWFSPVNVSQGPDGALYVVDMNRKVIEHPHWMPTELQQRSDLREGNDRGRIYRIVARNHDRKQPPPDIGSLPDAEVLKLLGHENGWHRDTASRLLLERQDDSLVSALTTQAVAGETAQSRVRALWAMDGLGRIETPLLLKLLRDHDPHVLVQAIVVAEQNHLITGPVRDAVESLQRHDEAIVRFQALLSAAPCRVSFRLPVDEWELRAMLLAVGDRASEALRQWLAEPPLKKTLSQERSPTNDENPESIVLLRELLDEIVESAAGSDRPQLNDRAELLEALLECEYYAVRGIGHYLASYHRRHGNVAPLLQEIRTKERDQLETLLRQAAAQAMNKETTSSVRCDAIDLLVHDVKSKHLLKQLAIDSREDTDVRCHAIQLLSQRDDLVDWKDFAPLLESSVPIVRTTLLDAFLAKPDRTRLLLEAIESDRITGTVLPADKRTVLLKHNDAALQTRATKLFHDSVQTNRASVFEQYRSAANMVGERDEGRKIFQQKCSQCHRIDGIGVNVGPDISDSRTKTAEQYLQDIVMPNRAVDGAYLGYAIVTHQGTIATGVLSAETSTSVTLRQVDGHTRVFYNDDIEQLHADGQSFMPEGLEEGLSLQQMADLLTFIKTWRYRVDNPTGWADDNPR
ncbi:MAG: c-type cytochrome [Planctomycetales bacterium]|nr:c-type cytochrome [Planctomycetales bacterium]